MAGGFLSGLGFGSGPLFAALFGLLFGLFEAVGLPVDRDDLGMVNQTIDQ